MLRASVFNEAKPGPMADDLNPGVGRFLENVGDILQPMPLAAGFREVHVNHHLQRRFASFVAGPSSTTLPMKVFSSVRLGISPKINALATIMVLAVSLAALVGWWIMARSEKRRQRDIQLALQDNA